jgi:hypothetical protein
MVLAFFNSKGLIYTNHMPWGTAVNASCIMDALDWLIKFLKQKKLVMPGTDWWFHWDNAPVHTAAVVTNWVVARQIKGDPVPAISTQSGTGVDHCCAGLHQGVLGSGMRAA